MTAASDTPTIHRRKFILHAISYFSFYHSRSGHIVFLPRVVFLLFSLLIMGKTRRCTGCKTSLPEHTFEKPGTSCSGPEQFSDVSVVEEDTAFPSQPIEDEPQETIEVNLASLLGAVKSLTTGLKEVQADNQQLCALLTNQSPIKEVPVPSTSTGGATASGVTLPKNCAQCKSCPTSRLTRRSAWVGGFQR